MIRWLKEIYAVGFFNWCWFVLYLKRNEFHWSLDRIKIVDGRYLIDERTERRQRAHEIDLILFDKINGWKRAVILVHKHKKNRRFFQ